MKTVQLIVVMLTIFCAGFNLYAAEGICPICGKEMETHIDNSMYLTDANTIYDSSTIGYIRSHYGEPLIKIELPNVCEDCRKKYGPSAKFYEDQLNSFWKRTVQDNEGIRKEKDIQRRDAQIKSLQNEIKRLKGE